MISFPVLFINLLSIGMVLGVAIAVWAVRRKQAAKQLLVVMCFLLFWSITSFGEMVSSSMTMKIVWRNLGQIGIFYTPVAVLSFVSAYTGYWKRWIRRLIIWSGAFQTVGILLVLTDFYHHWIRTSLTLVEGSYYKTLVVETTILAKVLISTNFFLLLISFILVGFFIITTPAKMKQQTTSLLLGMAIPIVYAMVKTVSNERFMEMLPISGVFAISCFCILFGIQRFDLLKLAPLAREQAFKFLGEGIIICDAESVILDMNNAAQKIFGSDLQQVGFTLNRLIPNWKEVSSQTGRRSYTFEFEGCTFSAEFYPIIYRKRDVAGTIILVHDVTLLRKRSELLRIRAEIDGLTGLYNRQTFIEKVEEQLDSAENPVHLIYFDIDHFKHINDTYGHRAGDAVLEAMGQLIKDEVDASYITGRFGGEEFVIFSAEATAEQVLSCAQRLRSLVEQYDFSHEQQHIHLTISLGVVSAGVLNFDELYRQADQFLYQAKRAGRNCIQGST